MSQDLIKMGLKGNEIGYQFVQVGTDRGAQGFLRNLTYDPLVKNFIDVTSWYEMEEIEWRKIGATLTPHLYATKLLLGGFDPEWSYDNK